MNIVEKRNFIFLIIGWGLLVLLVVLIFLIIKPYYYQQGYYQGGVDQKKLDIAIVDDYLVLPGNQIQDQESFVAKILGKGDNTLSVLALSVGRNPLVDERPQADVMVTGSTQYLNLQTSSQGTRDNESPSEMFFGFENLQIGDVVQIQVEDREEYVLSNIIASYVVLINVPQINQ